MASTSEVKQRLVECLRELHLPTFREEFEDLARRAVQESLSYEQYLGELADRECHMRRTKRIERWLRDSDLPVEKSLLYRLGVHRTSTPVSQGCLVIDCRPGKGILRWSTRRLTPSVQVR